jgi:hypothetical protein
LRRLEYHPYHSSCTYDCLFWKHMCIYINLHVHMIVYFTKIVPLLYQVKRATSVLHDRQA